MLIQKCGPLVVPMLDKQYVYKDDDTIYLKAFIESPVL